MHTIKAVIHYRLETTKWPVMLALFTFMRSRNILNSAPLSLLLHYNLQTVMKSLFLFRLLFYLFFYLEAYLANLQHVSMAQVQYGYPKNKLKFLGFKTKKCFCVCVCVTAVLYALKTIIK